MYYEHYMQQAFKGIDRRERTGWVVIQAVTVLRILLQHLLLNIYLLGIQKTHVNYQVMQKIYLPDNQETFLYLLLRWGPICLKRTECLWIFQMENTKYRAIVFNRLTQMIVHVHIRCTVFFTIEFRMICRISLAFHLLLIVLQLRLMAAVEGCMHLENMTNTHNEI